jgi:hypothetical protein
MPAHPVGGRAEKKGGKNRENDEKSENLVILDGKREKR